MKLIIDKNEAFILNDKEEKIASTVNDNLPFIDFNGFESVCEWFDIHKLAVDYCNKHYKQQDWEENYDNFLAGFQKAQELLSDRRFTLKEVEGLMFEIWNRSSSLDGDLKDKPIGTVLKWIENILSQPKSWPVEIEMEQTHWENSKLSYENKFKPKFTNGKVKILKVL
jgi:hypothetical protein